MTQVNLTLSAHKRFWFGPAFAVLAYACAAVSMVSMHAALWLSDKGCTFIARHGFKIVLDA